MFFHVLGVWLLWFGRRWSWWEASKHQLTDRHLSLFCNQTGFNYIIKSVTSWDLQPDIFTRLFASDPVSTEELPLTELHSWGSLRPGYGASTNPPVNFSTDVGLNRLSCVWLAGLCCSEGVGVEGWGRSVIDLKLKKFGNYWWNAIEIITNK